MEKANVKIDSFVHGKQSVLSFRRLSVELDVQYNTAQSYLQAYAANISVTDPVRVLWHIISDKNGTTCSKLTFAPPVNPCQKFVWAVGPKSLPTELSLWLKEDLSYDLTLTQTNSYESNSLRNGSHLSILSPTAVWDSRPDPRLSCTVPPPSFTRNSSSLLANVKAPKSLNSKLRKNHQNKPTSSTSKRNLPSAPPSNQSFLQRSMNRTKERGRESTSQPNLFRKSADSRIDRKSRRIIADDSNSEDHEENICNRNNGATIRDRGDIMDDGDTDSSQENDVFAMEREFAEEERAEAERADRGEHGLFPRDDEEPVSPVLKEVDSDEAMGIEVGPKNDPAGDAPNDATKSSKRSFFEPVGSLNCPRGARRIRKKMKQEFLQDGSFVTRMVVETYDDDGKKVESGTPEAGSKDRLVLPKFNNTNARASFSNRDGGATSKLVEKMPMDSEKANEKFIKRSNTSARPKPQKSAKISKNPHKDIGSYFTKKT